MGPASFGAYLCPAWLCWLEGKPDQLTGKQLDVTLRVDFRFVHLLGAHSALQLQSLNAPSGQLPEGSKMA